MGLNKTQIEERIESILDFAGIGEFIDKPVKTYSSGMILRLAFSVVAHVDADLLIIDEALAVGDAVFIQKCMRFIRNFKKRGTLILVSHDIAAIQSLCSECIWLSEGKLISKGSTENTTRQYLSFVLSSRSKDHHAKYETRGCNLTGSVDVESELHSGLAKIMSVTFLELTSSSVINSFVGGSVALEIVIEIKAILPDQLLVSFAKQIWAGPFLTLWVSNDRVSVISEKLKSKLHLSSKCQFCKKESTV